MNDPLPNRRSIRLKAYDYAQAGTYFITVCAYERRCIFGQVIEGQMRPSALGAIIEEEWYRSAEIRPSITLDFFVLMPNHVHGIIFITTPVGATGRSPARAAGPGRGSVGSFVSSFKAAASRRITRLPHPPDHPIWQRNYYDHIVRNEKELGAIQEYIFNNPANWSSDRQNPAAMLSPEPRPAWAD